MFSSNAFSFFLVLAVAFNPVTAAKEATLKLSYHPELRGASPTPVESLAAADSRTLEVDYPVGFPDAKGAWVGDWTGADQAGLAVHAGAAVVFTPPVTTISSGDVCGYAAITGLKDIDYVLGDGAIFVNGCNPADISLNGASLVDLLRDALAIQQATSPLGALALVSGELGGQTILPGAYKTDSAFSVAAGTVVTLQGNAESKFLFLSGAAVVTGAGTTFNLVPDDEDEEAGRPQAQNILFVSADATTTGAGSLLEGSILSRAAITLGAASEVTGGIFAMAAIGIGAGCAINKAEVVSPVYTLLNSAVPVGPGQPQPTGV
jgi:hypothetical protein